MEALFRAMAQNRKGFVGTNGKEQENYYNGYSFVFVENTIANQKEWLDPPKADISYQIKRREGEKGVVWFKKVIEIGPFGGESEETETILAHREIEQIRGPA